MDRQREGLLQRLFDRAPDGLVVTRLRDGRIVLVNDAFGRLLGYPPSELTGRSAEEFGLWPAATERAQVGVTVLVGGAHPPTESQLRTAGGRTIDVEISTEVVDIDGEPHAFGITREIAARKEADRELRAREERYRTLVQSSRDAILVTDATGRLTYCSPGVEYILGYAVDELIGTPERDLIHPDDLRILDRSLDRLLAERAPQPMTELRMRHRDGTWRWIETIDTNCLDTPAVAGIVTNARDVTARRSIDEALSFRALHDPLTGLPNRRLLHDRIELAVARASRTRKMVAVLFCDLDRFKDVNDRLGHEAGDELLRLVAQRLTAVLRPSDSLARLGGDEFVVVCSDMRSVDEAAQIAERIRAVIGAPAELSAGPISVTVSIGIATTDGPRHTPAEAGALLRNADAAMYRAKTRGRDGWEIFDAAMENLVRQRIELVEHLERALQRDEFEVFYQPVVRLSEGSIVGAEALLRWRHPTGLWRPGEFLEAAEDSGLIVQIGEWVIGQALDQLEAWRSLVPGPLWVSVNISARQLGDKRLPDILADRLAAGSLSPGSLRFELAETTVMEQVPAVDADLVRAVALGIRIGIDDFGTGYSSLTRLQRLPISFLKIDRSFLADFAPRSDGTDDHDHRTLIAAIIQLSRTLQIDAIAEGIETSAQGAALLEMGCTYGQGYLYGVPVSAPAMTRLLAGTNGRRREEEPPTP